MSNTEELTDEDKHFFYPGEYNVQNMCGFHTCREKVYGKYGFCEKHLREFLSKNTNIYFIICVGSNMVKIGKADDVNKRLKILQIGNPYKLVLAASFKAEAKYEFMLHEKLKDYRANGEWFTMSDRVINIIEIAEKEGIKGISQILNEA